jgi:ATP-dependent helicase/nuclease subunit B
MRVFSVPVSAPFLRTVIAALVDGRLVDGFEPARAPAELAQATLYLPTRRAGRMAREIFLDALKTDAVVLPRIVALGDIDEDELAFAEQAEPFGGTAPLDIPPKLGELDRRLTLATAGRGLGKKSGIGAAGRRRPGIDAGIGIRPGAPDGRHGHPRRRLGGA